MLTVCKGVFYFDEIAGKYRYLAKALGIKVPEFEYRYTNDEANAIADEEPYETTDSEFAEIAGEVL